MYYDREQKMKKTKSFWLYAIVILLYFLLIGIVITVLLLAPKYPSFTSEVASHAGPPHPAVPLPLPYPPEQNPIDHDGDVPYKYPIPDFKPSQKDPLYYEGINPRVLQTKESIPNPSNRMLQNSKFLQT